jgi:tRNA (guanine37-N1)-methyltransferase
LYIPLCRQPTEKEKRTLHENFPVMELLIHDFPEQIQRPTTFVGLLTEELRPHLLVSLPRSADFIGDIAVLEIPSELDAYKRKIGETLMIADKRVRTVLAKASAVGGVYRTREFEVIAGVPKTDTVHRENGSQLYVDLSKAYFSPRLSSEHARIAKLVNEGETVVDMFAGIGPFAIQIAKRHGGVRVYAIDINPYAVELLNKNIAANKVLAKVTSFVGDARKVINKRLVGVADRIIMNLPVKALEYVDVACAALKSTGGTMHFYAFTEASESTSAIEVRLVEAVEQAHRRVDKVIESRTVHATAPHRWQIVVDARII